MKIKNISSYFKKYIIIALLIRILLIPFFYHPDIKSQNFHYQFLSKGIFNIYQFIFDNKENLPYRDTFNYLPLTYFTFGLLQIVLKLFMPFDFIFWLNDWGGTQFNFANLPYFLLILKIPYIFLDIAVAWLLFKITNNKKIFLLWLFNPFSFYLIYVVQNFDIFPVFLTILSLYYIKSKPNLSFIIFGLAISLKIYPLILLPYFLIYQNKNIFRIFKYFIISLTPLIISILPFIFNQSFFQSFIGSGLTQKIFELKYFNIPIFPVLYTLFFIYSYFSNKKDFPFQILFIFLLFICTVNFHSQWILWFFPFLFLLKNINHSKIYFPLIAIFGFILLSIFFVNDNFLTWGHFVTVDPEFLLVSTPYQIITNRLYLNSNQIQIYFKLFITLISIILIYFYEKDTIRHNS